MRIPTDWDELGDWVINHPEDARDVIIILQREAAEYRNGLTKLYAEAIWMTGSKDFGEGGVAHHGFENGVRPVLEETRALLE